MGKDFGLELGTLNFIEKSLNKALIKKNSFSISVFGSRSTGKYRKYSDLDLYIQSNPPLSKTEISELGTYFNESDLPIKIDIVTPETVLELYKDRIESELNLWFTRPL